MMKEGDFIRLIRPRGRPPVRTIPNIFYWIDVIINTLFKNPWLLLGIIGGIGGYYIENTFEMLIVGFIVGAAVGYILIEEK